RASVPHLVGLTADRATYDPLIALARKTTNTNERTRYYSAAASARNADLARATLALTLTDELPTTLVGNVISTVASAGEQADLAWVFVQANFQALADKQGPSFRDYFVSNFMMNFSDAAPVPDVAAFGLVHATSGGKMVASRAEESILISAELKARALPALAAWIKKRNGQD